MQFLIVVAAVILKITPFKKLAHFRIVFTRDAQTFFIFDITILELSAIQILFFTLIITSSLFAVILFQLIKQLNWNNTDTECHISASFAFVHINVYKGEH